ncbi:MAG: VWA domain-containing protein [Calditrichaeota bacterium]|nr:MAG: VWA domain-containing protein [Calditrichota bacterium]
MSTIERIPDNVVISSLINLGVAIIGLVFLVVTPLFSVAAQPQIPQTEGCVALDLVVLLDQSSSMKTNDPNKLRIEALEQIVDQLGDNNLYFCRDAKHRMAIVGFGDTLPLEGKESSADDDVRVYVSDIVIAPQNPNAWINKTRNDIKNRLPGSEDLHGTDFLAAFQKAREILNTWDRQKIEGADRRKLVLVITDGGPCILAEGCGINPGYGPEQMRKHMQNLEKYLDPNSHYFPWRGAGNPNSVNISVVALNDEENPSYNYLEDKSEGSVSATWERITANHGGKFTPVATDKPQNLKLSTQVYDTLSPFLANHLERWECGKPLWVNPYDSSLLIIQVWRIGASAGHLPHDVKVKLRHTGFDGITVFEGGSPTNQNQSFVPRDYSATGLSERYVFYNPLPGKYEIQVEDGSCPDVDVRYGHDKVQLQVLEPASANGSDVLPAVLDTPHYDTSLLPQFRVKLFMHGDEGKLMPLVENPAFPLALNVVVTQPDNQKVVYPLVRTGEEEPGVFVSQDYIRTPVEGIYHWTVEGTTIDPRVALKEADDLPPVTVVEETDLTFQVTNVTRFDVTLVEPKTVPPINMVSPEGEMVPQPFDVAIRIVATGQDGKEGEPLNPQRIFSEPKEALQAELLDPNGQVIETIALRLVEPATGTYRGTFRQETKDVDPAGTYQIRVTLLSTYDRFAFSPVSLERTFAIERTRIYPVRAEIFTQATQNLHSSNFLESIRGVILPPDVQMRLFNQATNEPLLPEEILTEESINASIQTPAGILTGTFNVIADQETMPWRTTAPLPDAPGRYWGEVDLSTVSLQTGYEFFEDTIPFEFSRKDNLFSNPSVTRLIAGICAVLTLLLIVWIASILFFGPKGQLEIVNWKGETLEGPWQLKRIPSRNTIRSTALEDYGIGKIYVWRSHPPSFTETESRRAVRVRVLDINNQVVLDDTLVPEQSSPLTQEGDLMYR